MVSLRPLVTPPAFEALAGAVGLHPKHIRNSIRLAFLSPTATKAILDGQQRATLMFGDLDEDIALSWHKQQRQQEPCFERLDQPAPQWIGKAVDFDSAIRRFEPVNCE